MRKQSFLGISLPLGVLWVAAVVLLFGTAVAAVTPDHGEHASHRENYATTDPAPMAKGGGSKSFHFGQGDCVYAAGSCNLFIF